MPLPEPFKFERKDSFIERCMSNKTMKKEHKNIDERYAVCISLYESNKSPSK